MYTLVKKFSRCSPPLKIMGHSKLCHDNFFPRPYKTKMSKVVPWLLLVCVVSSSSLIMMMMMWRSVASFATVGHTPSPSSSSATMMCAQT